MDTNRFYSVREYRYSSYSYSGVEESAISFFRTLEAAEAFRIKRMKEVFEYHGELTPSIDEEVFLD